jgi:hydroxymethylpyrimidine/phosphomethylpyrimidine kinase
VAQNTRGVQSVYRIEPDFVAAQLDSVFSDVRIDTTKIGMLAETDIVEAVAERLKRYQVQNVVLDTVMLAKSGDPLLSASAVETLRTSCRRSAHHAQSAGSRRAAGRAARAN